MGEFYSVATANNYQQADTGTKMIHIGANTQEHHRLEGHLRRPRAEQLPRPGEDPAVARMARAISRSAIRCSWAATAARTPFPYIETRNPSATVEHEASTSKISEDQLFYCLQRGIEEEDAVNMIVSGFCKTVLKELPMEFAVEAQNLLAVSLEGAVG